MPRPLVALALAVVLPALRGQDPIPSPAEFFGFTLGEDRRLLRWEELCGYYDLLQERSPRIRTRSLGDTEGGRPLVALVVSSRSDEELEEVWRRQRTIALGESVERATDISEQPTVVYIQGTLHSTEIAASLLFPRLLHQLAAGEDAATRRILDAVVIVLVPSANPDGQDLVVDWYRRTLDTPWEGTSPPDLYHPYAGHDDNRDWFMLSLRETRLISRELYHRWLPEIVLDIHQMGSKGARMFVPPYADPLDPNIPTVVTRSIDLVGAHMALALANHDLKGVISGVRFDTWWNGGARSVPARHNMIGILTETASARLASPLWVSQEDLRGHGRGFPEHRKRRNFPDPWPGGWWRLADILRYQEVSTRAVLDFAARHREMVVLNFHRLARRAIARGRKEAPYGFIIPARQRDEAAVHRLLRNLADTGVRVHRARRPFTSDGVDHLPGSWVLSCAQPFRDHLRDLLEPQDYPELRMTRNGEVIQPYDVSGWTLPYQFGIRCIAAASPLPDDDTLVDVAEIPPPPSSFEGAESRDWALEPTNNQAFTVVNRALSSGIAVRQTDTLPLAFVFPDTARDRLAELAAGRGLRFLALGDRRSDELKHPRVALLLPYPPSMDAGWTRLVLEEHGFEPTLVRYSDLRAGSLKMRCDTLVIPSISESHNEGGPPPGRLPPRYRGGFGRMGAAALRQFVDEGGQLLVFNKSIPFVTRSLDLPVIQRRAADARCPGSILRAVPSDPGEIGDVTRRCLIGDPPGELAIYQSAPTFLSLVDDPTEIERFSVSPILSYPGSDLLLSGYLDGEAALAGRWLMASVDHGAGRVILYSFRPQHRSQTLGTFRLIFNALYR